ncbi:Beta-13-galactosyl-O-glycosyl-glycoprotein beta-16-N-acetylglucosaminyltransferase 4, partial [Taenia solium]|eukprot:TsM_001227300 transcript=TsM_001227300 gene=TsM_001227300
MFSSIVQPSFIWWESRIFERPTITRFPKVVDNTMNNRHHRRDNLRAILSIAAVFLILILVNMMERKEAVDGTLKNDSNYFVTVDLPLHLNCLRFRHKFPVVNDRDADMDTAFTSVVHEDPLQIARLLRMIYRKNNYYCIHADLRSNQHF